MKKIIFFILAIMPIFASAEDIKWKRVGQLGSMILWVSENYEINSAGNYVFQWKSTNPNAANSFYGRRNYYTINTVEISSDAKKKRALKYVVYSIDNEPTDTQEYTPGAYDPTGAGHWNDIDTYGEHWPIYKAIIDIIKSR